MTDLTKEQKENFIKYFENKYDKDWNIDNEKLMFRIYLLRKKKYGIE